MAAVSGGVFAVVLSLCDRMRGALWMSKNTKLRQNDMGGGTHYGDEREETGWH
jgi:hypothetical protein